MTLQQAIRLVLCGAASVGVAHAADNTTLAPVTIAADKSRVASEDTRDYTVPTMSSATGMALSAQETPQTVSVVTNNKCATRTSPPSPKPSKARPASPCANLTGDVTPSARAASASTNTRWTA